MSPLPHSLDRSMLQAHDVIPQVAVMCVFVIAMLRLQLKTTLCVQRHDFYFFSLDFSGVF